MSDNIGLDDLSDDLDAVLDSKTLETDLNDSGRDGRDLFQQLTYLKKSLDRHLKNETAHLSSPGKQAAQQASKSDPTDTMGASFDKASVEATEKLKTAVTGRR